MSGCDLRDILEVATEAIDVKVPALDMKDHIQGVVDLEGGTKRVQDMSVCDMRYIPEVARKMMDVKVPASDMRYHNPGEGNFIRKEDGA